jgi:predicted nuclease of restriction endonuclease-like RecB superfamily
MLRGEHVIARLSRGQVLPHRLSPDDVRALEIAEELCNLYADHQNHPRSDLEEALVAKEAVLGPRLDPRRGFKILRALAKLLEESAEWAAPTDADPYTIRTRLFELAATMPELPASEPGLLDTATRDQVVSRVARETGLEKPDELMYADRQGAQVLSVFDRPSAEDLIHRYNVAQVQGILYSAREMTVDLGAAADARLVFHYVKFMDLIYRLETTERGYRLHLDGPLSIFGSTRKYGLRLAKFLPGLMLTAPWKLLAKVDWRGREAALQLDSDSFGLTSHYAGPKEHREADDVRGAFVRAWERAKETGGWKLQPGAGVLPIPEQKAALVPDFTLEHGASGEKIHLEILGFWSERTLVDRVALIRAAEEKGHRVLIAVSENLGASSQALSSAVDGIVIPFKNRLKVNAVLGAADSNAAFPAT